MVTIRHAESNFNRTKGMESYKWKIRFAASLDREVVVTLAFGLRPLQTEVGHNTLTLNLTRFNPAFGLRPLQTQN